MPLDIDALLDEVERGRTEAFGRVVREYALPLRSYLASQVHHLEDVDDLAQDVFLAALESLPTFRRGDDFGAWLRGIARNKLLVHFRSQARRSHALRRFRDEVTARIEGDLERAMTSGREVARALRAAYLALHRQTNACFAMDGVTADQFVLLSALADADAVSQQELVRRVGSDHNTVRAMLVLLEGRG